MEIEANPKVESNMKNCMISQNILSTKEGVEQAFQIPGSKLS